MNTINSDESSSTAHNRPFGFWLKAVDRLMAAEFASAFESEGIARREWRLLNVIDGTVPGTKNDRPARTLPTHKLGRLIELGWVTDADNTWTLTDEGRAAKERLGNIVEGIRAKVTDAVPSEDLATTIATLEQLARAFGWDEGAPLPRRRGRGHGRGRGRDDGRGRGFGHRSFGPHGFGHRGFGPRHLDHATHGAPEFDGRDHCQHGAPDADRGHRGDGHGGHSHDSHDGHDGHGDHGHHAQDPQNHPSHQNRGPNGRARAHFARVAQGSYERGFDAGFTRGRDAQ